MENRVIASINEKLDDKHIHVWKYTLDQPQEIIDTLYTFLSPDERLKARRYHRNIDCLRYISGRGMLRKIISVYVDVAPVEVRFAYNRYGKPFIISYQNFRKINFNISHSRDLALYAFGIERRLGIDIEYIREDINIMEIAKSYFSEDEVNNLKALPNDKQIRAFFNCWSRKESYIKAIGMGVSFPLDKFTVTLDPDDEPMLVRVDSDKHQPARWRMYNLNVNNNYAASVIVEGPPLAIDLFDMNDFSADYT